MILDMLLCSCPQWLPMLESSSDPTPANVRIKVFSNLVLPSLEGAVSHLTLWKAKILDFLPFKLLLTPLFCAYHLLNHSSFIMTGSKSRWDSTTGITEAARRPLSTTLNLTDCLGPSVPFSVKNEV